jgi:uncharacterized protein YqeY
MKTELKALSMKLRKERDPIARLIVFHLAEVEKIGKNKDNRETTEEEAIQYVKKTVQKLKEDQFANNETQREVELLETLLPKMATEDEVREHISMLETEKGLDTTNKGMVMKAVKAEFGALVDMKMVAGML